MTFYRVTKIVRNRRTLDRIRRLNGQVVTPPLPRGAARIGWAKPWHHHWGFWWNLVCRIVQTAPLNLKRSKSKGLMGTLDFWCEGQIYIERMINKENNKSVRQAGEVRGRLVSLERRQEQGELLDHSNRPAWLIIDKAQWSGGWGDGAPEGSVDANQISVWSQGCKRFDVIPVFRRQWRRVKRWRCHWGSFQSLQVCCAFPVLCRCRRPLISYIINAALTLSQPCGDMKAGAIN